jgi:hypothetical protein
MEENKEDVKVIDDKVLPIPMLGKELGRFDGKTFYIAEHEYGVLYHVFNSMDLIIRPSQTSTCSTLVDLIHSQDEVAKFNEDEMEMYESYVSAIAYCLGMPLIAFIDAEFMFNTAKSAIDLLYKIQMEAEDAPLQEETPKENEEFKNAALAIETLKEAAEEESKPKGKNK